MLVKTLVFFAAAATSALAATLPVAFVKNITITVTADSTVSNQGQLTFAVRNPSPVAVKIGSAAARLGENGKTYIAFDTRFTTFTVPAGKEAVSPPVTATFTTGLFDFVGIVTESTIDIQDANFTVSLARGPSVPIKHYKQNKVPFSTQLNLDG